MRRVGIHGAGIIGISQAVNGAVGGVPLRSFFNQLYTGARQNITGQLGFKFTMVANTTVVALGRSISVAMIQTHRVGLWAETAALLGFVTITPASPVDALGYAYEMLGAPIVLTAGVPYRLASEEFNGGDLWMDLGATLNHTGIATINNGAYNIGVWPLWPGANGPLGEESFVVPTFYYY